jgi:Ca2+-dependent lipid-binding protein
LQGRDLLPCDYNGKSDPFVILSFNNKKGGVTQKKTKVIKKTLDPEWNEEFELYEKNANLY